jgi:hypothetical protein
MPYRLCVCHVCIVFVRCPENVMHLLSFIDDCRVDCDCEACDVRAREGRGAGVAYHPFV